MRTRSLLMTIALFLIILLGACNLPGAQEETPEMVASQVAETLTAFVVSVPISTSTPEPEELASSTPLATSTELMPTSTPQNPLVLQTILCWKGPGDPYEVVSALKTGERVELIGEGSIAGWWIVDNPIYHDPCWAQAVYIQIEPGYNTASLPIYTPPPSPTPTPSDTPTPTSTPTATNTP